MKNIDNVLELEFAQSFIGYFAFVAKILQAICPNEVAKFICVLCEARDHGPKNYFIRGGGKTSTASHFVNNLVFRVNSYSKSSGALILTYSQVTISPRVNDLSYGLK